MSATPRPAAPASPDAPGPSERKTCAVCHWASGILPVIPVSLDLRPTDIVRERAVLTVLAAIVRSPPDEVLPRGPPIDA
jgi:hypothetical protein